MKSFKVSVLSPGGSNALFAEIKHFKRHNFQIVNGCYHFFNKLNGLKINELTFPVNFSIVEELINELE